MDEIKKIIETYDTLSNLKRDFKKNFVSEAVFANPVPIPSGFRSNFGEKRSYEIHPGTDIPVPSGTEIKAPADGVVVTANPNLNSKCGGTIDIDYGNGLWSRFCHVKRLDVRAGDRISQGQVVGLTGGGSNDVGRGNSGGPHLHFSLKKDGQKVDPVKYMNSFDVGAQNLSDIKPSTDDSTDDDDSFDGTSKSSSSSSGSTLDNIGDKIVGDFIGKLASAVKMNEEKVYGSFGKGIKDMGGSYLLSKDKNNVIYSPVSGQINNVKINLGCKNQITIFHDVNGKEYHLEFCGISNPYVKNRDFVSQGTILGKTGDDVTVTLYDDKWKRTDLKRMSKVETSSKEENQKNKNIKNGSDKVKKPITPYRLKSGYQDPTVDLLGSILTYPFRAYERKKEDKSKASKFASPTSRNQPEPGFLLNMFKKKKVDENIERIKKLLK